MYHAGKEEMTDTEALKWLTARLKQYTNSLIPAYLEDKARKEAVMESVFESVEG